MKSHFSYSLYLLFSFMVIVGCKKTDEPYNANGEHDGKPCEGVPTIEWGGQIYNTVQIGSQCWMKENLNIGIMIPGVDNMSDNDTIEKYCYDDNPENCIVYGGLYQWDELMKYSESKGIQGICPDGWHIPTEHEWFKLFEHVGVSEAGGKLKEVGFDHWKEPNTGATNESGFTALPGGFGNVLSSQSGIVYRVLSERAFFWSSSQWSSIPMGFILVYDGTYTPGHGTVDNVGMSARCLKD